MTSTSANPAVLQVHKRLQTEFPFFAKYAPLKIIDKAGRSIFFVQNFAQQYIHRICEAQRKSLGMVRALLVKPRQIGSSTDRVLYNTWKVTRSPGRKAVTMAHLASTTTSLQDKVKYAIDNANPAAVPKMEISNQRRMVFEGIGSEITFGTAKSEEFGRGITPHDFHGSEVAFWAVPASLIAGVINGVPMGNDTSVFMESTTNGVGDWFHTAVQNSLQRKSPYVTLFVPWFWQVEYQMALEANEDWELDKDEEKLIQVFKLSQAQLKWRRFKIAELASQKLFKQEYPATLQEAFQFGGVPLLDGDAVLMARKCQVEVQEYEPLIFGGDFGGRTEGEKEKKPDRSTLVRRRGRTIFQNYECWVNLGPVDLANHYARLIHTEKPQKVFLDYGYGFAVADILYNLSSEFRQIVTLVQFGGAPRDNVKYANKRVEMAFDFKEWLDDGPVSIPDTDEFCTDIMSVPDATWTAGQKRRKLPAKDEIRSKTGFSPDFFDAACLTFAYPVKKTRLIVGTWGILNGVTAQSLVKSGRRGLSSRVYKRKM
jgi:hypothetical protein